MTKPVKVITAPVKLAGDFGGIFPQAIVAFYNMTAYNSTSMDASHGDPQYKVSSDLDEVVYSASFWYNQETKAAGFKPQPIENTNDDDEDGQCYVFTVDVTKPAYQNIKAAQIPIEDKILQIVDVHYKTEANK